MYYEKNYTLNWTWKYLDGTYCYSEYKGFNTEAEVNRFRLDLFSNPEIEVVYCKQTFEEYWIK